VAGILDVEAEGGPVRVGEFWRRQARQRLRLGVCGRGWAATTAACGRCAWAADGRVVAEAACGHSAGAEEEYAT